MAERVRVGGDLFHGRVPEGAVYVGRQAPGLRRSPFANPYPAKGPGRDEAVRRYRAYLRTRPDLVAAIRAEIGPTRDVACWCRVGEPCHGDVVLAVAAGADP
jgi:hypothetical protein